MLKSGLYCRPIGAVVKLRARERHLRAPTDPPGSGPDLRSKKGGGGGGVGLEWLYLVRIVSLDDLMSHVACCHGSRSLIHAQAVKKLRWTFMSCIIIRTDQL